MTVKELVVHYPEAKLIAHDMRIVPDAAGGMFVFGAVVFQDSGPKRREVGMERLHRACPGEGAPWKG